MTTSSAGAPGTRRRGDVRAGHRLADLIGWIVGLLLLIGLVYWLMRQGWNWRRTLQSRPAGAARRAGEPGPALLELERPLPRHHHRRATGWTGSPPTASASAAGPSSTLTDAGA